MKRKIKIAVDTAMYFIFLYLMSYRAGRGLLLHSVLGCVIFALFILHHFLNLNWYKSVKRKKNFFGNFILIIDFLLLADMIILAVSSVMLSGMVFSFSPFKITGTAHDLHVLSTSWGFVLSAFHFGLHTHFFFEKLHKRTLETFFAYSYNLIFILVAVVGIWRFWYSGMLQNMLFIYGGKSFSAAVFYFDHIMITVAVCQTVHIILTVFNKIKNNKRERSK